MKLNVLLFTADPSIPSLPALDKHYEWVVLGPSDVSTYALLSEQLRKYNPATMVTVGDHQCQSLFQLPYEYRKRWLHYDTLEKINPSHIEHCYIHAITLGKTSKENPLFSVVTTTFHSGDKILRPYYSLQSQTYRNWEWVVWDDSKNDHDEIWNRMLEYRKHDIRIHCFRAPEHSGFIGHMKWLSGSLCRGDWIVELDHDDIIDHRLFEWCKNAIDQHPDADFIVSDYIELHEGQEEIFHYGDFFGLGYGSYERRWLRNKWHCSSVNPDVNFRTIRHIVGVPNHVRIWKRTFYESIGRHNPHLPVVDDYELFMRTFLNGKCLHLRAPGYYQYRNRNANNFTFLRNSLIQHLTHKVRMIYEPQIQQYYQDAHIEDTVKYQWPSPAKPAWFHDGYSYDRFFTIYVPDMDVKDTVSVVMTVDDISLDELVHCLSLLMNQSYESWVLYIIGNKSETLETIMNRIAKTSEFTVILHKLRWWNFSEKHEEVQTLLNYAHRMLLITRWVTYLNPSSEWDTHYLERHLSSDHYEDQDSLVLFTDPSHISRFTVIHDTLLLRKHPFVNDETFQEYHHSPLSTA